MQNGNRVILCLEWLSPSATNQTENVALQKQDEIIGMDVTNNYPKVKYIKAMFLKNIYAKISLTVLMKIIVI